MWVVLCGCGLLYARRGSGERERLFIFIFIFFSVDIALEIHCEDWRN